MSYEDYTEEDSAWAKYSPRRIMEDDEFGSGVDFGRITSDVHVNPCLQFKHFEGDYD